MLGEFMQFYGQSWADTVEMPVSWFMKLYNRIPMIEARRQISQLKVISFPHLTDDGRQQTHMSLMVLSGYERMRQEVMERERYESGWSILRSFGRPARKGSS